MTKWCGREDSNFHGFYPTATSTLRVYQFRHGRTLRWRAYNDGQGRLASGFCGLSVIVCPAVRQALRVTVWQALLPSSPHHMPVPMKQFIRVGLFVLLIPVISACSGGSDSVSGSGGTMSEAAVADMSIPDMADQVVANGNSLSEILATVVDAETAEKAEPQIKAIVENYQLLLQRVENTDNIGFADMAALASRAPELARTQEAVSQQLVRIYQDHPEASDVLREALRDFGQP